MNFARVEAGVRRYHRVLFLGVCSEILYLLYFVRQFPLLHLWNKPYQDMGQITGHTHSAFVSFVGVMVWLFVLFGLALWQLPEERGSEGLWVVVGMGAVFAITMVFVYPVTALDIFAYIDQSLVAVQYHANPIFVPASVFSHDPLMGLSDGWAQFSAPYGPLGLVADALPTLVAGRNVLATLLLLKLLFSLLSLVAAWLVYQVLQHVSQRRALVGAMLVAWNPLVLFEISANGHNDMVMICLVLAGLLSLAERSLVRGPAWIILSALVKYASLVLLPPALIYGLTRYPTWRDRVRYLALTAGLMVSVCAIAYAPFWQGPDTFRRALMEGNFYLYSFSSALPQIVSSVTHDQATWLGRLLFLPVYAYTLWLARGGIADLLRSSFLATFAFLALAVNDVKYWYVVSPVVLAALVPGRVPWVCAIVMSLGMEIAAALNIYVWVWVGVTDANFHPINLASYGMVFVAPAILLVIGGLPYRGERFARWLHSASERMGRRPGGYPDTTSLE